MAKTTTKQKTKNTSKVSTKTKIKKTSPKKKLDSLQKFSATCSKNKLTAKFKREIKSTLTTMKEEILKDIAKVMKSESNHLKYEVGDFYDSASNDRERDLSLSLNQRDRQKLAMIEDALNRIESGTYGKCPYGNEVIDEERLRAMPFTRYCVSCMEDETTDSDF
tara:strand:- start:824 stop:1315 length:492 start_codon:yes stop_codon:yes gene_type:complete